MNLPINYKEISQTQRRLVREEYIRLQNGLCYYCNNPLDGPPTEAIKSKKINEKIFPKSMFKWPVHLHHDHNTGMTLGAVHCYCNAVMWEYEGV